MSKQEKFKKRRAAEIDFLVREGDAEKTIILLHGIGGRAHSFDAVMSHWPEGPQILAWDCPGYGGSQAVSPAAPAAAVYAHALVKALNELSIQSIDLMGQSLGALIAGSFATHFPQRLKRLILMCPALGHQTRASVMIPQALVQRISEHEELGQKAYAAVKAHRLFHTPERKPALVLEAQKLMATIAPSEHKQAVYALAQGDLALEAEAWQKHLLVIAGAGDIITPMAGTERLFDTLKSRPRTADVSEQLLVIGYAGHAVYLEHPEIVAGMASAFFSQRGA
jgi:pimeloyl-ACP methyl ester carboxylesterase